MSGVIKQQGAGGASGSVSRDVSSSAFVGMIQPFAMSGAPNGWLDCVGGTVSRATYVTLFTVIGTTWGSGDGSTTFTLPNLKGSFLRGEGNATAQMGNTNVYQGGSIGAVSNDISQDVSLGSQTALNKVGGPQYQGWFNGRTMGGHSMSFRTGTFYYDHNQGGNAPYSGQFNHHVGLSDNATGGTRRVGGETKPFSASIVYYIFSGVTV